MQKNDEKGYGNHNAIISLWEHVTHKIKIEKPQKYRKIATELSLF